jgi:hypothetical protein
VQPSDKPAETQGDGSSRIRIIFDVVTYRVIEGSGHLPYRVDSVLGRVYGLAIQVLNAPFGLLHLPLALCLCITGDTSKAFFYFSPDILGSSTCAIFVHRVLPDRQIDGLQTFELGVSSNQGLKVIVGLSRKTSASMTSRRSDHPTAGTARPHSARCGT